MEQPSEETIQWQHSENHRIACEKIRAYLDKEFGAWKTYLGQSSQKERIITVPILMASADEKTEDVCVGNLDFLMATGDIFPSQGSRKDFADAIALQGSKQ